MATSTINAEAQKVAAAVNKKLGPGTVVLGSEIRHDLVPRIPSGSLALDVILGGGWPANQWSEIVGEESHGKTCIALKTIAANQERDPDWTAVWIAAEQWVPQYARMLGVDVARVLVVETNVMEEAYGAVVDFTESKAVDCIVLDSLPALVPAEEDEKDMDGNTISAGARLTGKFFRKVGKATRRSLIEHERPILGLIINQFRQKIGVLHGDPRTTPGGVGKNYSFFVRLEVRRDEWVEIGSSGSKTRIGQSIKCRTIKNKTYPPQQLAYFDFYFDQGGPVPPGSYDFAKEIVSVGILREVIERRGGWFYYDDRKWQGAPALLASLREEIRLKEGLERDVLDSVRAETLQGIGDAA
jgi:recombination protein RecA